MTMQRIDLRRILGTTVLLTGLTLAACTGTMSSQSDHGGGMMGGGMMGGGYGWMGGYGGPWALILLVVIAGLVAWIISRGRNKN